MKARVFRLVTAMTWILLATETVFPCDLYVPIDKLDRTRQMVSGADLILRVTAGAYTVPPGTGPISLAFPGSRVRFSVEEVLKGGYTDREMVLPGILRDVDEWNPGSPPYVDPRHSADSSCFTNFYRAGAQFLLMLKRNGNDYAINWFPLGPVNEQLRSSEDPWVLWVRNQVKP